MKRRKVSKRKYAVLRVVYGKLRGTLINSITAFGISTEDLVVVRHDNQ